MVLALRFRVVHVSLKHIDNTDHDQQKYIHTHTTKHQYIQKCILQMKSIYLEETHLIKKKKKKKCFAGVLKK